MSMARLDVVAGGVECPERPGGSPDRTPQCHSGAGLGLPLQMHAFGPGGLHDHPPSTLLRDGGHAVLGGG